MGRGAEDRVPGLLRNSWLTRRAYRLITQGLIVRRSKTMRLAAGSIAAASLAVSGVLLPASPAVAAVDDCTLETTIYRESQGLYARAEVNCPQRENYSVHVQIYREDWFGSTEVAGEYKTTQHAGYDYVGASEPCSDVQTNKKYRAYGRLKQAGLGIDEKTHESATVQGHC